MDWKGQLTMIYMDNAATNMGNIGEFNINSPYADKTEFENARTRIANCLRVSRDNIYFTSGGCEANSWALQRSGCKNIITTKIEHPSVLNCCKWLEHNGCQVVYLDVDKNGYIDLLDLYETINKTPIGAPTLVSIMAVNNELGTVQNIKGIRQVIDYHNTLRQKASTETSTDFCEPIYYHADCVQAVGQIKLPYECFDMFSASGHKFGYDMGVGFLYSRIPMQPLIFGGSQEKGLRGGTSNAKSVIAMSHALQDKLQNAKALSRTKELVKHLRDSLKDFDCIINTPEESESGILSVSFKGVDAEKLMIFLAGFDVYVSAGSACSTDHKEPSHVLTAIKVPEEYLHGTIRFSLSSKLTGTEDVDKVIAYIKQYMELTNEQN